MRSQDFPDRFKQLTGYAPHPWQAALGSTDIPTERLIRIPTGMGKTMGVLAAWLFHRAERNDMRWPTRLVWCLPMRTLVQQTQREASQLLDAMGLTEQVGLHTLLGGIHEQRWYGDPEMPAILIGTQDMLLSRALNRGYAMGRAAWPRAFGLINTDALWVMDEVQLMGVGLTTSAQLQAFYPSGSDPDLVVSRPRHTWWMSATLQPGWLRSVETQPWLPTLASNMLSVDKSDRSGPVWDANKPVVRLDDDISSWAEVVIDRHRSHVPDDTTGRQTLVVLNTVKQATSLHQDIAKQLKGDTDAPALKLIHSRFRPHDRKAWTDDFLNRKASSASTNRIIIATQVVEAGVDISASCLLTELAPWPSLVQRFGRAARYGGTASIVVLDQQHTDDKKASPYSLQELASARQAINGLEDASIGRLEDFEESLSVDEIQSLYPFEPPHVLLRDDFDELFDTSPDLSGADVDVSRFIREGEDRDLKVFWRSYEGDQPPTTLRPVADELCSVSLLDARAWIKSKHMKSVPVWAWDYLDGRWIRAASENLRTGQVLLVSPVAGGYSETTGYTGAKPKKNEVVTEVPVDATAIDAASADYAEADESASVVDLWKTIATHSCEAASVVQRTCESFALGDRLCMILNLALRLHDWGKSHPAFARGTTRTLPPQDDLAKAPNAAWRAKQLLYQTDTHGPRRGFRHELASMLATMELLRCTDPMHPAVLGNLANVIESCGLSADKDPSDWAENEIAKELSSLSETEFNLLLFLIVSHHGKVRASLQAAPADQDFPITDQRYVGHGMPVRGIRESDELPSIRLPCGQQHASMPPMMLSLDMAAIGLSPRYGASWSERMSMLLDAIGPFSLAWLEAVVRAADGRASDDSRSPGNDADLLLTGIELTFEANPSLQESRQEPIHA